MSIGERLYTVEEFEAIADSDENRDRLLELINGEIVEKVPTQEHGLYTGNIFAPIWNYIQQRRSGRVVMEVRYRTVQDKRNSRIPDVSYTTGNELLVKEGAVPRMPDLAVEVQSPGQSLRDMREKARYYLANGSKLVWLVYPSQRIVEVYSPADEFILTEADTLTGGDVLPGFSMQVSAIFFDPAGREE